MLYNLTRESIMVTCSQKQLIKVTCNHKMWLCLIVIVLHDSRESLNLVGMFFTKNLYKKNSFYSLGIFVNLANIGL